MDAVLTAMVEDKIGPGEQARFLIQTARERIKFDYCLALRSPAIALYLALKALNLQKGHGVMVSALSPLYYARVIKDLELEICYCDVLSSTVTMNRETVEKAMAHKPADLEIKCIVLHHTLGYLTDSAAIAELGIPVIEDCSQSYGTVIGEEGTALETGAKENAGSVTSGGSAASASNLIPTGNIGVFTILGLEERDMLTSGGGALLYSSNRRDAAALRSLGDLPPEYGLPDMNAALAVVQFREGVKNIAKRREITRLYTQSALRTRHKRFFQPDVQNNKNAVFVNDESRESSIGQGGASSSGKQPVEYNNYAFPLLLESGMKEVKAYARRKEIAVENAFDNTLIGSGIVTPEQCPEAYSLSLRTILFPIYPRLGMTDAEKVAKLILTLP